MALANVVHKISDLVNKICSVLCIIMLVSMVIITGAQIVCRILFTALSWSEEMTRYLLVWSTFIGGSIVYKYSGHISVTLLQDHFPQAIQKAFRIIVHLVCGIFCTIAVYYGFKYMKMQGTQLSAALRVPMRFMYMAVPVGCLVIDLHIVDAILQLLTQKDVAEKEEYSA